MAAAIVFLAKWLIFGPQAIAGDGAAYLAMANGGTAEPPQSFHILTPWLAGHLSPAEPLNGFAIIAAVSFVGTAVCIGLIVRRAIPDASAAERALGATLFMATGTGVMMFRYYCFTDALSYFLLAVACVAILNKNDWLLTAATLMGIFNRETALFAMPVWLIFNFGRESWPGLTRRAALVVGPALAGYYILHQTTLIFGYIPPHLNYLVPENMLLLWRISIGWLGNDNIYLGLAICVLLAFGPVWFIAGCWIRECFRKKEWRDDRAFLALWGLAIPVIATLMIVDWRRGFQPLFPAMVVSSVLGIRMWSNRAGSLSWYILSVSTIISAAICAESWWFPPMRFPVALAMAVWLFGICLTAYLERGKRIERAGTAVPESLVETGKAADSGIQGFSRRFWLILPTYNEAANLPVLLERLDKLGLGLDILFVDDDSPDGTGHLADTYAWERPDVHVLRRSGKNGLGSAYIAGFKYALDAGAEAVITMDCDLSHQPEELPRLIEAERFAAVVVGSRYIPGGSIVNWPKRRLVLSATANHFVRALFGMAVEDCTTGFRIYRRDIAAEIVERRPLSPGYSFQVETLCIAAASAAVVKEVPICFVERSLGQSKMGFREIAYGALILISLRCRMWASDLFGDATHSGHAAFAPVDRTE